jgi:hypothetical protein
MTTQVYCPPGRTEHCAFAVLNKYGRCIASCYLNRPLDGIDCIGTEDPPHKNLSKQTRDYRGIRLTDKI